MKTYTGKYNSANVMIDSVDEATEAQINTFLNHPAFAKSYIAIMPDCHAGAGAVIGFTMKLNNHVIPNVVGVDIGCGVLAINLGSIAIDLPALDNFIKQNIPCGMKVRQTPLITPELKAKVESVSGTTNQNPQRAYLSIGTLGGGNHFIEVGEALNQDKWLFIHSGSRNFGLKIANYHQNRAKELLQEMLIDGYKTLEYLPMALGGKEYLADMHIAQEFAVQNRRTIANLLLAHLNTTGIEIIETVHNYISDDNYIRKGAVSAKEGERLIIPFNMRDGVAVCTGKGNKKWNYSAPHGAGRLLSRTQAKEQLSLEDFQADMQGIYTTTANRDTLDESPRAYKGSLAILMAISETVNVDFLVKPIYNFKAGEE